MWSRRSFVVALASLPLVAHARPAAPVWSVGKGKAATKITPTTVALFSTANANTQFTLWAVFPQQPDGPLSLAADGGTWTFDGFARDGATSIATPTVDRATAVRLARAFKLPLQERRKLDGGLQATWTIPPTASTRADVPVWVKLRVKNAGKTTIGLSIGGRNRGPRDNRFVFSITRNGAAVRIKDGFDDGGKMFFQALKPGEDTELAADLRDWADLTAPGHYGIDARYDGELAKDGVMPTMLAERQNVWDVALTGQGGILVQ